QFYGASASVRFSVRMLLDRRTIPCSEELDRLLAAHPLDLHHPVDVVAVSAADEAVVMVVVDDQARGVIIMEGAANFAVDQRFADQIRERNICYPVFVLLVLFEGGLLGSHDRIWRGDEAGLLAVDRFCRRRSALGLYVAQAGPDLGGDWQSLSPIRHHGH